MSLKISEMSDGGSIQPTDDIPLVRGGLNYRGQMPAVAPTTNTLSSTGNQMTSVVDGVSDDALIINSIASAYDGNFIEIEANGVVAPAVEVDGSTIKIVDPVTQNVNDETVIDAVVSAIYDRVYAPLSTYIVGTGAHSYATIQSAITQALNDGASNATPKVIFIQAGTYTENITLQAGIILIGANSKMYATPFSPSFPVPEVLAVKLTGKISYTGAADSFAKVKGIAITVPAGGVGCDPSTDSFLYFEDCIFSVTNNAHIFLSPLATGKFFFENCSSVGLGNFFSILFDLAQLRLLNCDIGNTLFGTVAANSCSLRTVNNQINTGNLSVTAGSLNITSNDTTFTNIVTSGGATVSGFFTGGNVSNITADSPSSLTFTNVQVFGTISGTVNYRKFNCRELAGLTISKNLTDYAGSENATDQKSVQTTNATPTTIVGPVLNANESYTVFGRVVGSSPAHTNFVGGSFTASAQRAGGVISLVGVPVPTVFSTGTGTFTVVADLTSSSIAVQVTGEAATTYNWVVTYQYHKVLTNS